MPKFVKTTAEPAALDASVKAVLKALRDHAYSGLRPAQVQALLAEIVTAVVLCREADDKLPAFPKDNDVSATSVAIAATAILEAADVAVSELGMWQTLKR